MHITCSSTAASCRSASRRDRSAACRARRWGLLLDPCWIAAHVFALDASEIKLLAEQFFAAIAADLDERRIALGDASLQIGGRDKRHALREDVFMAGLMLSAASASKSDTESTTTPTTRFTCIQRGVGAPAAMRRGAASDGTATCHGAWPRSALQHMLRVTDIRHANPDFGFSRVNVRCRGLPFA